MDPIKEFEKEVEERVQAQGRDAELRSIAHDFLVASVRSKYSYNFSWLGQPIFQYPQDLAVWQEIVWRIRPDLIIETGIARGGSLVFYASLLELTGKGRVLGVDVDIRAHNRERIEGHPMFHRIDMIQGSSIDDDVATEVAKRAAGADCVMVVLDANHTEAHVKRELALYAPLVTKGSYLVVCDTIIEDMPDDFYPDRPWSRGDNPRTAVRDFLHRDDAFEVDEAIESQILITVAPGGYLKRVQ